MDIFGISLQEVTMIVVIGLMVALYIAMLRHLFRQKNKSGVYKFAWAAAIVFLPVTGALLYYWFNVSDRERSDDAK